MVPASAPIRVLSVEDHECLVDGLRARFALHSDIELVGRLSTAEDLEPEVKRLKPDIVLMDIAMAGPDPFEAIEDLHRIHPEARVIILSAYLRDHYLDLATAAGAWGYIMKDDDPDVLIRAIRSVAAGTYVFSEDVTERCIRDRRAANSEPSPAPLSKLTSLTHREKEVLRFIGRGFSRAQIATTLHRSPKTIDAHRAAIMEKMDIHDRVALAIFAVREGLVEP
jgi:DNA-binding NarL/FixJ family response regulator